MVWVRLQYVRVRFRGRFRCQLIIDSRFPVHDPPGSGSDCRCRINDLLLLRTRQHTKQVYYTKILYRIQNALIQHNKVC